MKKPWRTTGRPTLPDVEKIVKEFPLLSDGDRVPFDRIAEIIKEDLETSRFFSVLYAYRKTMYRDKNIIFRVEGGIMTVENPSQRIGKSSRLVASGIKKMVRSGDLALKTTISGLTEAERRTRDHVIKISGTIKMIGATEAQKLIWGNKK